MITPMLLSHCTLTGVDDSVDLHDLVRVDHPIAEWGFLYSPTRQGQPGRYPSIATLNRAFRDLSPSVRVALHVDASGGRGVLETDWPQPLPSVRCGYAGGLGRDNLDEQLERIATIVGEQPVWVDMESSLRVKDTEGADWFNLARCQDCLAIASTRILWEAPVAPTAAGPRPSSLLRGSPA